MKNIAQKPAPGSCPIYKKCSGCSLRNMTYEEQLRFKYVMVDRLMGKLCKPEKVVGMPHNTGCRHKVEIAYDFIGGRAVCGIYRSATGGVAPTDSCPVNDSRANRIGKAVLETAVSLKIPVYCSYNGSGFLRHALIRTALHTDDIMCIVVGTDRNFPEKREFVKRLTKRCPEITSLIFSVSTSEKMTLGSYMEVLRGKGYMEDIICGKRLRTSPGSFAQVNPEQAEKLYKLALDMADIKPTDTVIDAYCGTGSLTLPAADRARLVYGCEINPSAAADGEENIRANGAENVRIVCSDSGKFLEEAVKGGIKADVVLLDPARAGCDRRVTANLAKLSPRRIVYISCDPQTQARDVFFLVKNGYRVKKLVPVDMFPHTRHVECIALLSRDDRGVK